MEKETSEDVSVVRFPDIAPHAEMTELEKVYAFMYSDCEETAQKRVEEMRRTNRSYERKRPRIPEIRVAFKKAIEALCAPCRSHMDETYVGKTEYAFSLAIRGGYQTLGQLSQALELENVTDSFLGTMAYMSRGVQFHMDTVQGAGEKKKAKRRAGAAAPK